MTRGLQSIISFRDKIFYSLIGSSAAATGIALSKGCQVRSCSACYGCIAGSSLILGFVVFKMFTNLFKRDRQNSDGKA